MPQITAIMIDNREPEYFQHLKFGGVPCMVTTLETGDIQAVTDDGCTLVFERKTPSDFLNTLREERLFPQLARMTENQSVTYWSYLVITGMLLPSSDGKVTADGRQTGWGFASVMGTILSIQEMGVYVCFCNGDLDYEDTILRVGKRDRKPETKILAPRPARMLGPKIALLCSLPGIGIEHAQAILQWAGDDLGQALTGLTDLEIKSPIGLSTRQRIRDLLSLQGTAKLDVTGTEILEPIIEGENHAS